MVGGVVIGLSRRNGEVHVNVADCPHYPKHGIKAESIEGCPHPDTCCVYTKEECVDQRAKDYQVEVRIQLGDSLWWQSGSCYWTPKENRGKENNRCGFDFDIRLPKLGYSH